MAPIRSLAEGGSFDPVVLDRLTDILENIWIEVGHAFVAAGSAAKRVSAGSGLIRRQSAPKIPRPS